MSESETLQAEPDLTLSSPPIQAPQKKALSSLQEARSNRAIDQVLEQYADLRAALNPFKQTIHRHREEVKRLFGKTRTVAWIWANVYGYGDDDLFPAPLYDAEAAYLAVVQAGVILVLDRERRRVACFVSDDGCVWKRYAIRRNTPLNNKSIYCCRIKRFPCAES